MEERNRSVKNAASKELYKLLLFFFFFFFITVACVQRAKNKSRTVDSIDLKTMFRKKFYRAYIIGASITFRVKIVAEMKLCTRCMLDSHLASTDLQFS